MDLGIEGRVALVTGASKGLGLGVATALANEGATVAIASRSEERIESAADRIGARPFVHDTADADSAQALVDRVQEELGPVDILVANSGGPPASPDALSFSHDQWRSAYELLLLGALALVEAVLPGMRERGWGRVLSLSSSVVREPSPVLVLSAAHRAGLLAALKTIARQVAPVSRSSAQTARTGSPRFPPVGSGPWRSSPRQARSCARSRLRTSPRRPCSSTAAPSGRCDAP
jgi:3-oxoacyl-[acyl-carrier protein] reductase